MAKVLVLYDRIDDHIETIAEAIAERARWQGAHVARIASKLVA